MLSMFFLGDLYQVLCSSGGSNSLINNYIWSLLKLVDLDSPLSVKNSFFFLRSAKSWREEGQKAVLH